MKMGRGKLLILLGMSLVCMLGSGCGKDTSTQEQDSNRAEIIQIYQEMDSQQGNTESNEEESEMEQTIVFDAVKDWDELPSGYHAIQIDDELYFLGMTLGEVVQRLDASVIDYTFQFESDALEPSCKKDKSSGEGYYNLIVERPYGNFVNSDGTQAYKEFFQFNAVNVFEEEKKRSELIVTDIHVDYEYYPNCKFINGMSYQEICEMDEAAILELNRKLGRQESDLRPTVSEKDGKEYKDYHLSWGDYYLPDMEWTNCKFFGADSMILTVDTSTSKVEKVFYWSGSGVNQWTRGVYFKIETLADFTEDELTFLHGESAKVLQEAYEGSNLNSLGYLICYNVGGDINYIEIYEIEKADGKKVYNYVVFYSVIHNYLHELEYNGRTMAEEASSFDRLVNRDHILYAPSVLDSTLETRDR